MYLQGQSIFLLKKKKKADLTEKNFCMMYHLEILISGGVFPILKAPSSKPWNILHLAIKILLISKWWLIFLPHSPCFSKQLKIVSTKQTPTDTIVFLLLYFTSNYRNIF